MKKIRPIIKWTGGKFDEFSSFSAYLPAFNRYYEPFFGGGGTFFALQPAGKSFLNDKSTDLINFYRSLNSSFFKIELTKYADAWEETTRLSAQLIPELLPLYQSFINEGIQSADFKRTGSDVLLKALKKNGTVLTDDSFIVDSKKLFSFIGASVGDKCERLKRIIKQKGCGFEDEELSDHIETAIKSGFYFFLRYLTNLHLAGTLQMNCEKAAANWYFVREFCYASMFRYSRKGNFNIPYGGIAYNRKNFRQKVENVFSDDVKSLFSNADLYNLDFESFLQETHPSATDFIFLDPPYDSEFSEYDKNVFSKADQQRLRDTLLRTSAQWMLVIKETDYIRRLYNSSKCRIVEFDKTYTYNVRGRNNRETRHLIIVNYDL